MKQIKKIPPIPFSCWGLWLLLLAVGGFHPFVNCGIAALFLGYLLFSCKGQSPLSWPISYGGVFALILVTFYLLTSLWGVESGSAIIGFFHFLPLPLYLLLAHKEQEVGKALATLPYALGVGTLLSLLGMALPVVKEYFTVAGRLGGILQYPNTFGLLLLVGQLLLVAKEKWNQWDFATLFVLLAGIFLTGSRTVFVLFLAGNVGALFWIKNKKIKWSLLATLPLGLGLAVGICALTGNMDVITRYLSLSVWESTFVGRMLYVWDALPVVLTHPFGLGYMGYAYGQPAFQTGLYEVLYAHNEFLQMVLDVGWIPFGLFGFLWIKTLCSKDLPGHIKWIFLVMTAHALLDFDFQYVGVFALYLLLMPPLTKPVLVKNPKGFGVVATALLPLCLYFGCGLGIGFFGGVTTQMEMLPFSTKTAVSSLTQQSSQWEKQVLGQNLVKYNPNFYLGHSLLANQAFSDGDMVEMIDQYTTALDLAPFHTDLYTTFAYELAQAVMLYEQAGDEASAQYCREQLETVPLYLDAAREKLSTLGKKINDQPALDETEEYIATLITQVAKTG